jgi:hypothetical protein
MISQGEQGGVAAPARKYREASSVGADGAVVQENRILMLDPTRRLRGTRKLRGNFLIAQPPLLSRPVQQGKSRNVDLYINSLGY